MIQVINEKTREAGRPGPGDECKNKYSTLPADSEITFHEVANLFPEMTGQELEALRDDIQANGLRTAVQVWRGQVIDGRHRVRVCQELGLDIPVEHLPDDANPVLVALSLNLVRRQLTVGQRAVIAEQLATLAHGCRPHSPKELCGQHSPKELCDGKTMRQAAEALGVSPASVKRVRELRKADPEALDAVKRGEKSIGKAHSEAKQAPAPDWRLEKKKALSHLAAFVRAVDDMQRLFKDTVRHADALDYYRDLYTLVETWGSK